MTQNQNQQQSPNIMHLKMFKHLSIWDEHIYGNEVHDEIKRKINSGNAFIIVSKTVIIPYTLQNAEDQDIQNNIATTFVWV